MKKALAVLPAPFSFPMRGGIKDLNDLNDLKDLNDLNDASGA